MFHDSSIMQMYDLQVPEDNAVACSACDDSDLFVYLKHEPKFRTQLRLSLK